MTRRHLFCLAIPVAAATAADPLPNDDLIYDLVRRRLTADRDVKIRELAVEVKDGVVTLKGIVTEERLRSRSEKIAKKVKGVKSVVNELRVQK